MKARASLSSALKYSGLALPLTAVALWLAVRWYSLNDPAFAQGRVSNGFLLVHALLASTIILQGCRFFWFLRQKGIGWLLLVAGTVYTAAIIGFIFKLF